MNLTKENTMNSEYHKITWAGSRRRHEIKALTIPRGSALKEICRS